jgi:hypothetical protein
VAVELTGVVHAGDLDALRRLIADRPELASVRMIGRKGPDGGWRTSLHAAADWPGYFPAAPATVVLLLAAGADPNDDCGGERPETPLHWSARTDDLEVAVALIEGGAELETPGRVHRHPAGQRDRLLLLACRPAAGRSRRPGGQPLARRGAGHARPRGAIARTAAAGRWRGRNSP